MAKVVTFGICFDCPHPGINVLFKRIVLMWFTGGEANVAVSLANYGLDSYFVSKVPKHEIGQCAVDHLRRYGYIPTI